MRQRSLVEVRMPKHGSFRSRPAMIGTTLGLLALTGCPRSTAIWVIGQEEPGRPVFAFAKSYRGDPTYLTHLHVHSCDDRDGTARTAICFCGRMEKADRLNASSTGRCRPGSTLRITCRTSAPTMSRPRSDATATSHSRTVPGPCGSVSLRTAPSLIATCVPLLMRRKLVPVELTGDPAPLLLICVQLDSGVR